MSAARGSHWTRRSLAVALAAGLGVALATGRWRLPGRRMTSAPPSPFEDVRAARAVGRRYLADAPGETCRAVLLDRLGPLAPATDRPEDPAAYRRRLRAARQAELAAGETVLVDGWVLARSEARLCALAALA